MNENAKEYVDNKFLKENGYSESFIRWLEKNNIESYYNDAWIQTTTQTLQRIQTWLKIYLNENENKT